MRLSEKHINTIKYQAQSLFGDDVKVILFGSRVDDEKKGGDIDLLIISKQKYDSKELLNLKLLFLVRVKMKIGDQKIDCIIKHINNKNEEIVTEAEKMGIVL